MAESLKDKTIKKIKRMRKYWTLISEDCGVSRDWLKKMAYGKIDNPGVKSCEKVMDWSITKHARDNAR